MFGGLAARAGKGAGGGCLGRVISGKNKRYPAAESGWGRGGAGGDEGRPEWEVGSWE